MPIVTAQERLGTCIAGRYRVERMLASGGMSVLFQAHDLRARRPVALKLLKPEDCIEERRVARFLQEMRLTAELRHPHVVDVFDLGDDAGVPYLIMELLRGRSLQLELDERGRLEFGEACARLLPIMQALSAVHDAAVVHRDVKPDNIFLHLDFRGSLVPKLLDFGIAKSAAASIATRTGAVLGTPSYMAPEQLFEQVVGPAADVWAMGAVLYRTLSGRTPYPTTNAGRTIAKLATEPVPPLRVEGLPAPICVVIDRALARDPRDRYPDMRAFTEALTVCAREAGIPLTEAGAPLLSATPSVSQRTLTATASLPETASPRDREAKGSAAAATWLLALAALLIAPGGASDRWPDDMRPSPTGHGPGAELRPLRAGGTAEAHRQRPGGAAVAWSAFARARSVPAGTRTRVEPPSSRISPAMPPVSSVFPTAVLVQSAQAEAFAAQAARTSPNATHVRSAAPGADTVDVPARSTSRTQPSPAPRSEPIAARTAKVAGPVGAARAAALTRDAGRFPHQRRRASASPPARFSRVLRAHDLPIAVRW